MENKKIMSKKKQDMAFVNSALPNYVEENVEDILIESVTGFKTGEIVSWQEGIKKTEDMIYLDVSPTKQAGGCNVSASGDTTFTDKEITVVMRDFKIDLCMKTLIGKSTQKRLPAGSNAENEAFTFESEIVSDFLAKIRRENETDTWQGLASNGNGEFDGYIKIIDDATTAATVTAGAFVATTEYQILTVGTTDYTLIGASANTIGTIFTATGVGAGTGTAVETTAAKIGNTSAATSVTNSNAFDIVRDICDQTPVRIKDATNRTLFVGHDFYDHYTNSLFDVNSFWAEASDGYDSTVPTKGVRIVAVSGLDGTNRAFLSKADNLRLGTDLQHDYEETRSWYDENTKLTYLETEYKLGAQIAFEGEVVQFTLA